MRILTGLLAATAILAAGCGGSSKDTAATTAAADTTAAATETVGTSTDTTSEGTTSSDTTSVDDITSAAGLSEGCKQVAAMSIAFANAMAAAGATGADTADLEKAAAESEALAAKLPDEIRDAVTTLADAYAQYAKAIAGLNLKPGTTPDAGTIAKLAELTKTFDDQSIKDANERVTAWAEENCSGSG